MSDYFNVLIIDDEDDTLELFSHIIKEHGAKPRTASDGEEAALIIHTALTPLHLIILDLNMPRMPGTRFLQLYRQKQWTIPVLILTGEHLVTSAQESLLRQGASGFISKDDERGFTEEIVRRIDAWKRTRS